MKALLQRWFVAARDHLAGHPTRIAVVATAGFVGLGLGAPAGDDVYAYMWADDRFCNDCHVHDYANEAFERSVHHGVTTCHDCHLVPIRHYPRNLVVTLFDPPQGPEDIHTPDVETVICVRCHSVQTDTHALTGPMPAELRAEIIKIDDSKGHLRHLKSLRRDPNSDTLAEPKEENWVEQHGVKPEWYAGVIECMDCHGKDSSRAHEFDATSDNCIACHDKDQPTAHENQTLDCKSCHYSEFVGH